MVTQETTKELLRAAKKAMSESNAGKYPTGELTKVIITDSFGTVLIIKKD